jgi:type IV pilus assembly protein PilM
MAKTILGVDIGHDSLKLALVSGNRVRKVAVAQMPEKLIREGHVVSIETMGELIRQTMKKNGMHCKSAALVIPNENVFIRSVTMPLMTVDQLNYNLPFEFRDYISDELKNYIFDYAVTSKHEAVPEEGAEQTEKDEAGGEVLELMAVAAPKTLIEESRAIMHKAGLKLVKAAPSISAFRSLILEEAKNNTDESKEYCILDMGYSSIRMHMFKGDKQVVTRALEVGMRNIDTVIADAYSVDEHLAHTYLLNNYEDCQHKDYCTNAFGNMTVELMRALNFYRFSNPDSHLEDIWICGGGACIEPLEKAIEENLDMKIHPASELIPGGDKVENDYTVLQAIGIALN